MSAPEPIPGEVPAGAPDKQPQGDGSPDAPPHPGVASPGGDPVNEAGRPPGPPSAPAHLTLREGAIYPAPDGEEWLVWVIRNGVVEYFARRNGGRWAATLDRGLLSVDDFSQRVGAGPG